MPDAPPPSVTVPSVPSTSRPKDDVVTQPERIIDPACDFVLLEIQEERIRAHRKHGSTSMESLAVDDLTRLTVLMEEVGEVASEFNEARHYGFLDTPCLRTELIQVAAMAAAWADALTHESALPEHAHNWIPETVPDDVAAGGAS